MRFYTYCLFSASSSNKRWRVKLNTLRNPSAPMGLLFHDENHPLHVSHIQPALYAFYKQRWGTTEAEHARAIVVRVNEHTLAATWSMSGWPMPHRNVPKWKGQGVVTPPVYPAPVGEEHSEAPSLTGWLISDVRTLRSDVTDISWGDMYDKCMQMMRLSGDCPCVLKEEICMSTNVLPHLPESFIGPMNTHFQIDPELFNKKAFIDLEGFSFVKPSYTVGEDFMPAERGWDEHVFFQVHSRKETFQKRGRKRSRKTRLRASVEGCASCVLTKFSYKTGKPSGCAAIETCTQKVTQEEIDTYLRDLRKMFGWDTKSAFSPLERAYLARMAGASVRTDTVTGHRKIDALLCGFIKIRGIWRYVIGAAKGKLDRSARFDNYRDVYEAVGEQLNLIPPDSKAMLEVPLLPDRAASVLAIIGRNPWPYVYNKGALQLYAVRYSDRGDITGTAVNSAPYEHDAFHVDINGDPAQWVPALPISMSDMIAKIAMRKQSQDK